MGYLLKGMLDSTENEDSTPQREATDSHVWPHIPSHPAASPGAYFY